MTSLTLKGLALAAIAAGFVALAPAGASAAPINPSPIAAQENADVTQVHWRGHHRGGWYRGHHRHRGWYGHRHHRHYGWNNHRPRFYYY